MVEEHIYHEYASWKLENIEFIQHLKSSDSSLMIRFNHVLAVVDHLYDKLVESMSYTDDEINIFQSGFYYLADQIDEIQSLLKDFYQEDLTVLETKSKEINLLLSVIDFQNELMSVESFEQEDLDKLIDFENNVLEKLKQHIDIPESMYIELDDLTFALFKKLDVDFYPINDIFLEIADEMGIIQS
jgi:hypothetical protein